MSILFFDTETTGLPLRNNLTRELSNPEDFEKYQNARLIEIAYKIVSATDILSSSTLVKNETLKIDNTSIHGISTELALKHGKDISELLDEMLEDLNTYDVQKIVAHNVEFDFNILLAECYRYNKQDFIKKLSNINEKYCTMKESYKFFNFKKFPKLSELYEYLFKKTFQNQHTALSDCDACMKCYNEMLIRLK